MPLPDRIDRLRAHFRRTPSPSAGPASPPAAFNPGQRDPPHLVAPPQPFRPRSTHAATSSPDDDGNDLSLRRSNSASSRFSQAPTIHDGMTPRIGDLVGGEGRSLEQSMRNAAGEFGQRFHQIVMLKQFVLWKQGRSETDERRTLSRRAVIERCQTSLVGVKDVMVELDSANRVRPLTLVEPRLSDITDDLERYSHTRLFADIAFSPEAVVRLESIVGVGGELLFSPSSHRLRGRPPRRRLFAKSLLLAPPVSGSGLTLVAGVFCTEVPPGRTPNLPSGQGQRARARDFESLAEEDLRDLLETKRDAARRRTCASKRPPAVHAPRSGSTAPPAPVRSISPSRTLRKSSSSSLEPLGRDSLVRPAQLFKRDQELEQLARITARVYNKNRQQVVSFAAFLRKEISVKQILEECGDSFVGIRSVTVWINSHDSKLDIVEPNLEADLVTFRQKRGGAFIHAAVSISPSAFAEVDGTTGRGIRTLSRASSSSRHPQPAELFAHSLLLAPTPDGNSLTLAAGSSARRFRREKLGVKVKSCSL